MISQKIVQLATVVFFSMFMVACGSDKDSSDGGAMDSKAPVAEESAGSLMDDAKDSAESMMESVEGEVSDALEAGEEAIEDAEDMAEDMHDEAEAKMEGMMDHMKK